MVFLFFIGLTEGNEIKLVMSYYLNELKAVMSDLYSVYIWDDYSKVYKIKEIWVDKYERAVHVVKIL